MKVVIDIPDDWERRIKRNIRPNTIECGELVESIWNGKMLPKGHGRLIDADELLKAIDTWDKFGFEHTGCFVRNPEDDFITYVHHDDIVISIRDAETIIEADKEVEDDNILHQNRT